MFSSSECTIFRPLSELHEAVDTLFPLPPPLHQIDLSEGETMGDVQAQRREQVLLNLAAKAFLGMCFQRAAAEEAQSCTTADSEAGEGSNGRQQDGTPLLKKSHLRKTWIHVGQVGQSVVQQLKSGPMAKYRDVVGSTKGIFQVLENVSDPRGPVRCVTQDGGSTRMMQVDANCLWKVAKALPVRGAAHLGSGAAAAPAAAAGRVVAIPVSGNIPTLRSPAGTSWNSITASGSGSGAGRTISLSGSTPNTVLATNGYVTKAAAPAASSLSASSVSSLGTSKFDRAKGNPLDLELVARLEQLPKAKLWELLHAAKVMVPATPPSSAASNKEVSDLQLIQACVSSVIKGFFCTFSFKEVSATGLAEYAPTLHISCLHLSKELGSGSVGQEEAVERLYALIDKRSCQGVLKLLKTFDKSHSRVSLDAERLWACRPVSWQPGAGVRVNGNTLSAAAAPQAARWDFRLLESPLPPPSATDDDGWVTVGQTDKQSARKRVAEATRNSSLPLGLLLAAVQKLHPAVDSGAMNNLGRMPVSGKTESQLRQYLLYHMVAKILVEGSGEAASPAESRSQIKVTKKQLQGYTLYATTIAVELRRQLMAGQEMSAWQALAGPDFTKGLTSALQDAATFTVDNMADGCTKVVGLNADAVWSAASQILAAERDPQQATPTAQILAPPSEAILLGMPPASPTSSVSSETSAGMTLREELLDLRQRPGLCSEAIPSIYNAGTAPIPSVFNAGTFHAPPVYHTGSDDGGPWGPAQATPGRFSSDVFQKLTGSFLSASAIPSVTPEDDPLGGPAPELAEMVSGPVEGDAIFDPALMDEVVEDRAQLLLLQWQLMQAVEQVWPRHRSSSASTSSTYGSASCPMGVPVGRFFCNYVARKAVSEGTRRIMDELQTAGPSKGVMVCAFSFVVPLQTAGEEALEAWQQQLLDLQQQRRHQGFPAAGLPSWSGMSPDSAQGGGTVESLEDVAACLLSWQQGPQHQGLGTSSKEEELLIRMLYVPPDDAAAELAHASSAANVMVQLQGRELLDVASSIREAEELEKQLMLPLL